MFPWCGRVGICCGGCPSPVRGLLGGRSLHKVRATPRLSVTMTSQNVLRGAGGSDDAGDGWLPPPPLVVKKRNGLVGSHLRLLFLFPMVPVVPRVGCLLVRLVAFRLVCVLMLAYSLFLLRLPLCKLWLRQRSKFLLRARWLLMDPRLNGLVRSA